MFEYVLHFRRKIFMTCKQLLLGSNIRDYDWTFHPGSLFLSNLLWNCLDIYECFEWKTDTWACKQLLLGLSVRDYYWTFHTGSLFFSFITKRRRVCILVKDEYLWLAINYYLGLIFGAITGPFTQVVFFFHYFKMVKVWISHFEFDCEKSLMLGQVLIYICRWIVKAVFKWLWIHGENYLIYENCSTLDQAYFCSFWKWLILCNRNKIKENGKIITRPENGDTFC